MSTQPNIFMLCYVWNNSSVVQWLPIINFFIYFEKLVNELLLNNKINIVKT